MNWDRAGGFEFMVRGKGDDKSTWVSKIIESSSANEKRLNTLYSRQVQLLQFR